MSIRDHRGIVGSKKMRGYYKKRDMDSNDTVFMETVGVSTLLYKYEKGYGLLFIFSVMYSDSLYD